jgi:hypothetical protein
MPKRVVDGDSLWRSEKLNHVEPPSFRAEYANLIPLALANGSFEADPRLVWATVYAYNRPEITVETVEALLVEFMRVKMLFIWRDARNGKQWGFWVGIDRPGRLPGKSRHGTNERVGAAPPEDELRKFLDSDCFHTEKSGFQELPHGNEKLLGFGSGIGKGSGSGTTLAHSGNERGECDSLDISGNGGSKPAERPSGDASNEKRLTAASRSILIADLYNRYARKVGKAEAFKAIGKAISLTAKAGATDTHSDFHGDEGAAAQWLGT